MIENKKNTKISVSIESNPDANIEEKFVKWASCMNSYFYELNEFSLLKTQIADADQLIQRYGLPDSRFVRSKFIAAYFNTLLFVMPDAKKIEPWYQRVIECYDDITELEDRIILYNHLMLYNIWNGKLDHARMLYKDFLGIDTVEISNPLIHMMRFTMCAQIEWLNMNVEKSVGYVEEGLRFAEEADVSQWNAQLAGQAVFAFILVQDFEQAEQWLQRVEGYKNPERTLDNAQYHYLRAWLSFHVGQLQASCSHAQRAVELTQQAGVPFTEAAARILLAGILYQQSNYAKASWQLALALRIGRRMQSGHISFAALLAASWVARDFHLEKIGIKRLRQAFKLGADNSYYNVPGWSHLIMAELCQLALNEGIEKEYTCQLISLHHMQPANLANVPSDWPWPVELFCFGTLRIRVRGKDVIPGTRQQRVIELLKLLVIHPVGIANPKICDLLWPDAEGDSAMRSLYVTQLRLRKLLEHQDALVVHQGRTSLNAAVVMNEMVAVKHELKEVNRSSCDGGEMMTRLMQRYRGRLLEHDENLSWLASRRENLHRGFLKSVESHVKNLLAQLNYELAESVCLDMLEIDEMAEDIYFQLLHLYQLLGSSSKVYHLYEQYRLLLEQNGLLPSENIRRFQPQLR